MSTPTQDTAVQTSIVVQASAARAFAVFTADMASWWPADHHLLEGELAEMVFEPHVGGRVYDRAVDGSECCWARVLAYEPPHRVVFSWDIGLDWKIESDPARTSEVEVTFEQQTPDSTLVTLRHSHLERHGDGWERMREAVGSDRGWGTGMRAFGARMQL
jgi:uncharacterized protein YndB with AHSA1/START domain